jgi:hypothetical protein
VVPNFLEIVQVLPNDVNLGESVLRPIRVAVKGVVADLTVLFPDNLILHILRVIVQASGWVGSVELKLLVLAETFQVIDCHQDSGQLSDLLHGLG